jgi:hypothetical protein
VYGISPPFGGMGLPRGKPKWHPVGKRNELVCCSRGMGTKGNLTRRRSVGVGSFSAAPSRRLMRTGLKYMTHERDDVFPPTHRDCKPGQWSSFSRDRDVALTRLPLCSLMNLQSPTYATKFTGHFPSRDCE